MIKAKRILEGVLLRPLSVGAKAVFLHGDDLVRTSRVVAIHSVTEEKVCFETLNTTYQLHLLTGPTYEPATCRFPMAVAA